MTFPPASASQIDEACAALERLGGFPPAIARGLAARDVEALRQAVLHRLGQKRTQGLREILDGLRASENLGAFARVQTSRLLRLAGDYAAALADLEEATALFPERAAPFWWTARAQCLSELGRASEAESVAREAMRRFPADAPAAVFLARLLIQAGRWEDSLPVWRTAQALGAPEALIGQARALMRLGRATEALACLSQRVAEAPDDVEAWGETLALGIETGDADLRARALGTLTGPFADRAPAQAFAELARLRHDARDFNGGAAALAELERRFPASPLAERERYRLAIWLERGQDELTAMTQAALTRFPDDPHALGRLARAHLALGRLDRAEAVVETLEARKAPGAASARLRLEAIRGGDARLRELAPILTDAPDADAPGLADVLIQHRSPEAFALADERIARFAPRGGVGALALAARVKIARREDEAAADLVAAIPPEWRRPDILELRAWAAHRRGALEEAQALWREILRESWFGAVECPVETLERLTPDLPPPEGGVTAFVVYRNEAPQWPAFLAHHRRLGVERFVAFDHMSDDGSCARLRAEPDVVLYQSRDSYQRASSGRRWIAEVIAREGARGWGLVIDADEHFIYPGWETTRLRDFTAYLDAHGFTGVRAYMLDMFAERLVGEDGEPAPLSDHVWHDADYQDIGLVRPPYLSPFGGVRQRLFGATGALHKTPLFRLDAGRMLNSHETTPLAFADVSGALLHYKLYNMTLRGRGVPAEAGGLPYLEPDTDIEVLRRHSNDAARLATLWRADLVDPRVSRRLGDSLDMTARGLMTASPEYLAQRAQARAGGSASRAAGQGSEWPRNAQGL